MCIPMEQVCDGHIQCVHGDDETLCGFQCPANCTCAGFYSNCSAVDFELTTIPSIPQNTRYLDLSYNNKLSFVLQDAWLKTKLLSVLNISHCHIESISRHAFDNMRNLRLLDLSFNKLSRISEFVFGSLKKLTTLILRGNGNISVIETNAFDGLSQVQSLDFNTMKLSKISAGTFAGLNLTTADLSNNRLTAIEDFAFSDSIIENINFEGNDIKHFNKEIFTGLTGLKTLRTSAFKFCCIRPNYVREENCYPQRDEFSSCEDLMRNPALQFLLWLIGVTALIGNFLTIIYRTKYDKKRLKLGFGIFTTNLAVADFLMGVYLLIIAIADAAFRKRYIYVSDYWKGSAWCNLAGILSTMSSEASVLFLCLITLDRILIIKYPFGDVRISKEKAIACTSFTWLFAVTIAVFPLTYEHYFKNMFYSRSGVCIALPLTRDRPPGWIYSLTLFVGLNFITFIMVAFGQLSIFFGMKESTGNATTAEAARKRDLKVARNLLLVVATDFLCWFPIGVMGIMALSGHVISGDVYAWAAVFILPINSALNPILYTLTAIIAGTKFQPSTKDQSVKQITKETGESMLTFYTISSRITQKELPVSKYSTQEELTGTVMIKGELFISFKPEDKANDIYELGMFLRGLINIKKKKC
ncbi:G-protein coupled receptor GRL101-like [Mercenaria mercenaria]|uniref:G-protein coupled receptor GRL101-like n=1 Tax=Mercenaria mercenaria TaxID=6596 RepID=UPI00234EDA77|nr:G-protein coupled receptor GRL101-like [Mercenaria mercenaria]